MKTHMNSIIIGLALIIATLIYCGTLYNIELTQMSQDSPEISQKQEKMVHSWGAVYFIDGKKIVVQGIRNTRGYSLLERKNEYIFKTGSTVRIITKENLHNLEYEEK